VLRVFLIAVSALLDVAVQCNLRASPQCHYAFLKMCTDSLHRKSLPSVAVDCASQRLQSPGKVIGSDGLLCENLSNYVRHKCERNPCHSKA
jgi:hypothetical protein